MANKFDHMEDSVRKAFDGFELPVRDLDWSAISNGLDAAAPTEKGFVAWWNKNKKRNWFILGLLLLLIGGSFVLLNHTDTKEKQALVGIENQSATHTPAPKSGSEVKAPVQTEQAKGNGGSSASQPVAGSHVSKSETGGINNLGDAGSVKTNNNEATKPAEIKVNNPAPLKPAAPATPAIPAEPVSPVIPAPISTPTKPQQPIVPATQTEPVITPAVDADIDFKLNVAAGLKAQGLSLKQSLQPTLNKNLVQTTMPRKLNLGWEWYTSLQANFDNTKATATAGEGIWNGVKMQNSRHGQGNVRFETGLTYRQQGWSLGSGLGFETGAFSYRKDDTIYVKVVTKSLKYITLQGDSFWLVMKSKDSMIIIKHPLVRQWIEVPVYFTKRFYLGHNLRFTAGFSVHPGFMAGAQGSIANPYAYGQELYMAPYTNGDPMLQAKTVAAKQYLNAFRMGNGLQLGVEKQMDAFNFGLQFTTRYYYTPVWKSGVPLQQHTFNYGLNIRIGVKF